MKYNEKYDLFVDNDLVIYSWDKNLDKLVQCVVSKDSHGYMIVRTLTGYKMAHRIIWETLKGEIPDGYEIDHINTIRDDNRLENLRCVTHKENINNPLTIKHISEARIGKHPWNYGKTNVYSEETIKSLSKAHTGKKLSKEHKSNISKGKKGKMCSDFGKKFLEHYGSTITNYRKLYFKERYWYLTHNNTCSWEE